MIFTHTYITATGMVMLSTIITATSIVTFPTMMCRCAEEAVVEASGAVTQSRVHVVAGSSR